MNHLKRKGLICLVVLMLVFALYLGVDYFNLPSKMGISVENLNLELLSIVVGNAIVIIIAAITFILIDARSIEKDRLAKYAAASLLYEAYNNIESISIVIKKAMSSIDKIDNSKIELFNQKQIDFFETRASDKDEIIFENLSSGNIEADYYDNYKKAKTYFDGALLFLQSGSLISCKNFIDSSDELLKKEQNRLKTYMESLKIKKHSNTKIKKNLQTESGETKA